LFVEKEKDQIARALLGTVVRPLLLTVARSCYYHLSAFTTRSNPVVRSGGGNEPLPPEFLLPPLRHPTARRRSTGAIQCTQRKWFCKPTLL